MKNMFAVIGAAYGDEGKGVFTNYLSSINNGKNYSIRFNGGAQAGHTVCYNNSRHVFGHIGANSFLDNSETVLSKFFVVNPILFIKEMDLFEKNNHLPKIYVNKDCYVTTIFDMLINQFLEKSRNNKKHGSCGVGFGQTIQRQEIDKISLKYSDLYLEKKDIFLKLKEIQNYFFDFIEKNNLSIFLKDKDYLYKNDFLDHIIEQFIFFKNKTFIYSNESDIIDFKKDNIVFEGAQGLLLDQDYGTFPYVTRSNTGAKNISIILNENNLTEQEINILYATRSYTTRHGAGPLKNELDNKPYENIVDLTNIPNDYQDSLRFSYLDLNILKDAIYYDLTYLKNNNYNFGLGVSCLDQSNSFNYYLDNNLLQCHNKKFANIINEFINSYFLIESFSSLGPQNNKKFLKLKN